jgi:hypothetical protein
MSMNHMQAEYWAEQLRRAGYAHVGAGMVDWGDEKFFFVTVDVDGHPYQVNTQAGAENFIANGPPGETKKAKNYWAKQPREEQHMERYLECRLCGKRFSADPIHYQGWEGYLSHCGRALRLYHRNPIDGAEYLIAETVDLDYLKQPHMDDYAPHDPLSYHASQSYWGVESTTGKYAGPPKIPDSDWQRWQDPGFIGLILYHAGYKRNGEGTWTKAKKLQAGKDYHRFEDSDRIIYETTDPIPFQMLQTHRAPDRWGIRFPAA